METFNVSVKSYVTGEDLYFLNHFRELHVKGTDLKALLKEANRESDDLMRRSRNGLITAIECDNIRILNIFNKKRVVKAGGISFEIMPYVPKRILDTKLTDLMCKHVLSIGERETVLIEESKKLGYEWCQWGTHSGHTDRKYHKNIIDNMIKDDLKNSIRVVTCKYKFSDEVFLWADNLHSTVRHIKQKGTDAKLEDVPFYCIDLSDAKSIKVYSYKDSLSNDLDDILGAINCAEKRFNRSNSKKLIEVNYRVEDFIKENKDLLYWV